MLNLGFPTQPDLPYPYAGYPTSSNFLQQSLGSFWNQIFSERSTIRGYTIGEAEELLQAYQDLTEVVYSFGVKDVTLWHTQLWQPLTVKKSQLSMSPFIFEPDNAVFGPQPSTDLYYAGQVFQFGYPKSPSAQVYTITPSFQVGEFSVIANRVYNPSNYYLEGVDVILGNDNTLFFNANPFLNPKNTLIDLIDSSGKPVTYVDADGVTQTDQLLILWMYNVGLDEDFVYRNFGYIFQITQPTSEQYKDILKSFFNIAVDGATILALKSLMAYIGGIVPVIEPYETVQYVATTQYNKIVVTDSNAYSFTLDSKIRSSVVSGAVFRAGDTFTDLFNYYDEVEQKSWWQQVFQNNAQVGFASSLFLGSYKYQLFLQNSLQLITLSPSGQLYFPIQGNADDVKEFEAYINIPANKNAICAALGLTTSSNPNQNFSSVPVNPLNFVFENFFKNNTSLFVLNFYSPNQTAEFLNLFEKVKQYLPSHVYVLLLITINNTPEIYNQLNGHYTIAAYPGQVFNCDGSNAQGNIPSEAPYYYTNVPIRLFALGKSPVIGGSHGSLLDSLDSVGCNGVTGNNGTCIDAKVFTQIPAGATTRAIGTLKLIDFST